MTSATMYIVSTDDIPYEMDTLIDKGLEHHHNRVELLAMGQSSDVGSVFTTPLPAEGQDYETTRLVLFGMAFEEQWCLDDVLIVIVFDDTTSIAIIR